MVIEAVNGTHSEEKSNDDVNVFDIQASRKLRYMPKGIEMFFSNLEGIQITETSLTAITQKDLKPFPNLKALYLTYNQLTTLQSELFLFNSKLKAVYFYVNHLNYIAADIFDPVEDLEVADFGQNLCISKDGTTRDDVKDVKKEISEKCQNTLE